MSEHVLQELQKNGEIELEPVQLEEALNMHGHMLDFKKRGTFLRLNAQKASGKPIPEFGYRPSQIPFARKIVEKVLSVLFSVGQHSISRKLVSLIPVSLLGPLFDVLRKTWKSVSKPTKRKGLKQIDFEFTGSHDRWNEILNLASLKRDSGSDTVKK
jgi:coenzyme F420 hydrogenase subunit beta